jgi:hypothetical protein
MEITAQTAIEMLSFIPARPDYENWVKIISAIGNHFDEPTALSILRTRFNEENRNETQRKLRNRLKSITIGTLVYEAKQNGYKFANTENIHTDKPQQAFQPRPIEKPKIEITAVEEPIYDEKNPESVRLYRACVNFSIINKNLNAMTKKPNTNFIDLTNNFQNVEVDLWTLINIISSGHSVIFAHLREDQDGTIKRKSENFLCAELLALDFDTNVTIEEVLQMELSKRAILLYTTCSHTDQAHRFRLVFDTKLCFKNSLEYRQVIEGFQDYYQFADKSCKDVTRVFYGNNQAVIYDLLNGEIYDYSKQVQI